MNTKSICQSFLIFYVSPPYTNNLLTPASLAKCVYADINLMHLDDAYYSFYTDGWRHWSCMEAAVYAALKPFQLFLMKIRLIIPNQCKNNNSNPKGALLFEKKEKAANGSSSDTSSSDTEHNKTDKTPQKRTRITSKVDMDENFTADIAVADMGLDTFTSQPIFLIPAGPSS
ncbi:7026_t:CDS:2 [Rhizophagus irregularis]|nr:7026_t:CDS:2 [Rhizophagus irregularis]